VTLSIDEQLLKKAREIAESLGTSVNGLIRHYLEELTSPFGVEAELAELERLSREAKGDPRGWKLNCDEIHERA
jgi:hypothetical protein